jgi:hypothetical protein
MGMTPRTRQGALGFALALLLAAGLACAVPGLPEATDTPDATTAGYLGAFDCNGLENGLGAYTGRLTFAAPPDVSFTPGSGDATTGSYAYDSTGNTFTFGAGFVFDTAIYDPNTDGLVATVTAGTTLAHAEGGTVTCVRAQPGITGP